MSSTINAEFRYLEEILHHTPYRGRHTKFMFMGHKRGMSLYKHVDTRRYINTDGRLCFEFDTAGDQCHGAYRMVDADAHIARAFRV